MKVRARKDEEIKARVDGRTKAQLWQIASDRELDVSDIVREAVRDLIKRQYQPPREARAA